MRRDIPRHPHTVGVHPLALVVGADPTDVSRYVIVLYLSGQMTNTITERCFGSRALCPRFIAPVDADFFVVVLAGGSLACCGYAASERPL